MGHGSRKMTHFHLWGQLSHSSSPVHADADEGNPFSSFFPTNRFFSDYPIFYEVVSLLNISLFPKHSTTVSDFILTSLDLAAPTLFWPKVTLFVAFDLYGVSLEVRPSFFSLLRQVLTVFKILALKHSRKFAIKSLLNNPPPFLSGRINEGQDSMKV